MRDLRIRFQILALQLERLESKSKAIPEPILIEAENLLRDLKRVNEKKDR